MKNWFQKHKHSLITLGLCLILIGLVVLPFVPAMLAHKEYQKTKEGPLLEITNFQPLPSPLNQIHVQVRANYASEDFVTQATLAAGNHIQEKGFYNAKFKSIQIVQRFDDELPPEIIVVVFDSTAE